MDITNDLNAPTPHPPSPAARPAPSWRKRTPRRRQHAADDAAAPPPRKRPSNRPDTQRRSAFDPWQRSSSTTDSTACPNAFVRGHLTDRSTGEMTPIVTGCGRWACGVCGPTLLGRHMAHFKEVWAPSLGHLLFVTLTLRPADADRMRGQQRADALRLMFTSRLVRSVTRRERKRPRYLAQVDLNEYGSHHHLHGIIETDLDPGLIAGLWVNAGGGLDSEVIPIRATADDLARVAGYVVKGCRWSTGRLMCSRSLGYNTRAAKAERRAHAIANAGGTRDPRPFEPVEHEPGQRHPAPVPQFDLFESVADVPTVHRSPILLRGAEYALTRRYDEAMQYVSRTVDLVDRTGNRTVYTPLAVAQTSRAARRFAHRHAARQRAQRTVQ